MSSPQIYPDICEHPYWVYELIFFSCHLLHDEAFWIFRLQTRISLGFKLVVNFNQLSFKWMIPRTCTVCSAYYLLAFSVITRFVCNDVTGACAVRTIFLAWRRFTCRGCIISLAQRQPRYPSILLPPSQVRQQQDWCYIGSYWLKKVAMVKTRIGLGNYCACTGLWTQSPGEGRNAILFRCRRQELEWWWLQTSRSLLKIVLISSKNFFSPYICGA